MTDTHNIYNNKINNHQFCIYSKNQKKITKKKPN